jgi:hypothetical protein
MSFPTPAVLFASIVFGLIGLVAFNYGRKNMLVGPMVTGAALMVFPYVVSQTWAIYLVGVVLCGLLYIWRD